MPNYSKSKRFFKIEFGFDKKDPQACLEIYELHEEFKEIESRLPNNSLTAFTDGSWKGNFFAQLENYQEGNSGFYISKFRGVIRCCLECVFGGEWGWFWMNLRSRCPRCKHFQSSENHSIKKTVIFSFWIETDAPPHTNCTSNPAINVRTLRTEIIGNEESNGIY